MNIPTTTSAALIPPPTSGYSANLRNETASDETQDTKQQNPQDAARTETSSANKALDPEQQRILETLKQRDREVRAHEAAHVAAAGGLVMRGANFSYQKGPDGQRYAVGGDVQIDVSPVAGDPAATISKSEQIRRAALAPANPSSQDISVAAMATRMAAEARIELIEQRSTPDNQTNAPINNYLRTQNTTDIANQFNSYA